MKIYLKIYVQSATMTSEQNTFMFLKAGPYNGTSDELYSKIVRYFQMIDKTSLKKRNYTISGIILYTRKGIMCPF
jgi:hypothetical protein